jgi:hypothetical protein
MKNLKEIKGVKALSKEDQKMVKGGKRMCLEGPNPCPVNQCCVQGICDYCIE